MAAQAQRSSWPPKMAVCVGAIVLRGERALLVRQAPGASMAGSWSIPWGVVDEGEWPEAAVVREVREEGGIVAEVEGLLGIQNLPREGWIGILYLCRHVRGEPACDGVETDRAAYLSLAEIDALAEPVEDLSGWMARRVLRGEHRVVPPERANPYRPRMGFM